MKYIDIIQYIKNIVDDNSLIILLDNKYIINPQFSLEYINLLFIVNNLYISNYYSENNENINILIFKKEIFDLILEDNKLPYNLYEKENMLIINQYLLILFLIKLNHSKHLLCEKL